MCVFCDNAKCKNVIQEEFEMFWKDSVYIFKRVPVKKCEECNEVFLTSTVLRLSQKIMKFLYETPENIKVLNLSEVFDNVNNFKDQDTLIEGLYKGTIQIKKISNEYRITRTDILNNMKNAVNNETLAAAARDGKINLDDLRAIENHLKSEENDVD